VVWLCGPSGAGKTTLCRALAGLAPVPDVDANIVWQSGVPVAERVGHLAQDGGLLDQLTVEANLRLALQASGRSDDEARCFALLQAVGLPPETSQRLPSQLSGGMRRRAALAQQLAQRRRVLLLDEPFAGLDNDNVARLLALLREVCSRNSVAVVLVTHHESFAVALHPKATVALMPRPRAVDECDEHYIDAFCDDECPPGPSSAAGAAGGAAGGGSRRGARATLRRALGACLATCGFRGERAPPPPSAHAVGFASRLRVRLLEYGLAPLPHCVVGFFLVGTSCARPPPACPPAARPPPRSGTVGGSDRRRSPAATHVTTHPSVLDPHPPTAHLTSPRRLALLVLALVHSLQPGREVVAFLRAKVPWAEQTALPLVEPFLRERAAAAHARAYAIVMCDSSVKASRRLVGAVSATTHGLLRVHPTLTSSRRV